MSSEIKVTNIKHSSSGSNNLVLGSDGTTTVSGALTASDLVSLSNGINGVRTNQNSSTQEVTLDSSFQTVVSTTITPKSSSSKLLVLGVFTAFTLSAGSNLRARIRLTATGHTTSYSDEQQYIGYQSSSDTQLMAYVPINYIFTVSNTNLYTITMQGKAHGGTGKASYDDSGGDQISTLQVIEI
tara:strand:+ start:47 stop:598 length:552 start_codon:yes stop_codon:yes gene_type:complete